MSERYTLSSLMEKLSGARYLHFDAKSRRAYAWYGGAFVQVYNMRGTEVDFIHLDNYPQDLKCALAYIDRHLGNDNRRRKSVYD